MSEQLNIPSPETTPEITQEVRTERPKAEFNPAEQEQRAESARAALSAIEQTSANKLHVPQVPVDDRPQLIDKATKNLRMRQNLSQLQKRLTGPQKSFSKIIHQPLVQKVSETSSQTVARPSGMFGGGLLAFVGSLGYLWLTHHYSLQYNYFFFVIFFVGGFLIGLLGEYGLYALHRLRSR